MGKKNLIFCIPFLIFIIEAKSQENIKDDFKPHGKIIGQVFGDYMYVAKADTGVLDLENAVLNKKESFNSFQLRLLHLGYEYYFSPKISSLIQTDIDENSLSSDGNITPFIKDAWIKWNIFKNHDIIFGIQDVVQLATCENAWGHRYLEKSISDLRGLVGGREFGLSFRGKNDKTAYGIMLANGNGLNPENDNYKRLFSNFEFKPLKDLVLQAYCDANFKPKTGDLEKNEYSGGLVAEYTIAKKYSIGFDGFYKRAQNGNFNGTTYSYLDTYAISTFMYAQISKKNELVFRYDYYVPNKDNNTTSNSRGYILAAYVFSPIPDFQISPNILVESYEKKGNKNIEPSIWARLTLNWVLNK